MHLLWFLPLYVCIVGGSGSFSTIFVFLFSYVWNPESPPIWETVADSVYHLSCLFTDVTLCCNFFPLEYCERSLGSDLSVPDRCPLNLQVKGNDQEQNQTPYPTFET